MALKGYEMAGDDDRDLLRQIQERIEAADKVTNEDRQAAREDLEFLLPGNQWPADAKRRRKNRPCLEVDRLNPYINQIVNEQRENRPSPQVNPTGDGANKETAEVLQGMIRHIMYVSDGDIAIDTAYENMIKCGRGFLRVVTEYEGENTFNQAIRIKRIHDPLDTVFLDPACQCPVASDAEWGAIVTWLTKDQYEAEYPNSELAKQDKAVWEGFGHDKPEWAEGNGCRVVEYYCKEREAYDIYDIDGQAVESKQLAKPEGVDDADWKAYLKSLRKRTAYRTIIKWYKVNAIEVLDSTEWPGKYIPIVPVYGNEHYLDGKISRSGLTRSAKDPARLYNVFKSAQAEMIALAPKAPVIAAQGSIVDKQAWQNVHSNPKAVLEYTAFDQQGNQLPAPQPLMFEPPIQAISAAMMGSDEDIKAVTGMWNPSMGINESGQSGVAIRQLQRQGQVVNYHYVDNLSRSVRHLGRIIIDLIPKVYDVPRVVRVVKPDQTEELVQINAPTQDQKGIQRIYDVSVGEYDVTVSVGPSYQTKRQEQLALLESLMQGPLGQLIAVKAPDLIASMMDFEVSKDLQERLTPPEFAQQAQGIPPQVQQQMQQMQQAIQALQQQNQQLQSGAEVKMQMAQLDMQVEAQKMQANMELEAQKAQADAAIQLQKARIDAEVEIQKAKIKAETELVIAEMRAKAGLQEKVASAAVNNAMQTGAKDVEIEVGGEAPESEYDNAVGTNAGMEE